MKGKTLGLTEFLADGASGPGASQTVVTRKSSNWADDVENEDGKHYYLSYIPCFQYSIDLSRLSEEGILMRDTRKIIGLLLGNDVYGEAELM